MPTYNVIWLDSDAQLLEAILLATGGETGAPLHEILLMADALDGAVYTLKEVEEALEKLVAAQLVHIQKSKLALTSNFLQAHKSIEEAEESQQAILALLQNIVLTETSINSAKEALKKYKLKNQYQAYLEQFGGE